MHWVHSVAYVCVGCAWFWLISSVSFSKFEPSEARNFSRYDRYSLTSPSMVISGILPRRKPWACSCGKLPQSEKLLPSEKELRGVNNWFSDRIECSVNQSHLTCVEHEWWSSMHLAYRPISFHLSLEHFQILIYFGLMFESVALIFRFPQLARNSDQCYWVLIITFWSCQPPVEEWGK